MILYHGLRNGITSNISPISRERCDFGKGFYLGCGMLHPLTLISNETNPKFYKIKLNTTNLKNIFCWPKSKMGYDNRLL